MLRFEGTKVTKKRFYTAKKHISFWDINVDNIVISKLVKTKTNSKYLTGYLDKVRRLLVLIMAKMSEYIKTLKVKDGDKNKNNINWCLSVWWWKTIRKNMKLFGLRLKT